MPKSLYQILIVFSLISLIVPSFVFAQDATETPSAPETLEDAGNFVLKILKTLPEAVKKAWEKAKEIWRGMADWFLENVWNKILALFGKEVEKRKEIISGELEEEKEELKKEAEKAGQSLWQRIKDIIKSKL